MGGDRTLSAPARPDLWLCEEVTPPVRTDVSEVDASGPQALSTALLGASPVPKPLRRRHAHTLVPSALDAHTFATLSKDDAWFSDAEPTASDVEPGAAQPWDDDWTLDEDTMDVEIIQGLPRVLGAVVELGVFFMGLGIGLAVQGAFAWVVWTALV
ncbi:MAG: hypothetical protein ACJAZO_002635 [Myxococcota bacterium]|jgi:hypothetical protein